MYMDYCDGEQTSLCEALTVRRIYRVLADDTYQVNHPVNLTGRKIYIYTDLGQGKLSCCDGEFFLEAGSALVFRADSPFCYSTLGKQWHFWWFEFDGEPACVYGMVYPVKEREWMCELFKRALESLRCSGAGASAYLSCLLSMTAETARETQEPERELFMKAAGLIRENGYRMNVASLAEELNIHPRTLYNLFQHYGGCSPKVYLRNSVMDMSKFLLRNTTKNIGEIAEEMGFSNQFHFSRLFKEMFAVSPSAYRKG